MMLKKKGTGIVIAAVMALTLSTGAAFATEADQEKPVLPKDCIVDARETISTIKAETSWQETAKKNAKRLFGTNDFLRIYGADRYDTSLATADKLKQCLGCDKFSTIIVASGETYPDALSGSLLAFAYEAPILLVSNETKTQDEILHYIENNLNTRGRVYLLGGEGAVSRSFEQGVRRIANVKRLGGADRYETNLAILNEFPFEKENKIAAMVCSGTGFADCLSASAVGLPILLVGDELTAQQKQYLDEQITYAFILGGTGAVTSKVENQVNVYIEFGARIAGDTRYETSVEWAEASHKGAEHVALAYAQNFPDGLSMGALASEINAPLVLVDNHSYQAAAEFAAKAGIQRVAVSGGPSLISDRVAGSMIHK